MLWQKLSIQAIAKKEKKNWIFSEEESVQIVSIIIIIFKYSRIMKIPRWIVLVNVGENQTKQGIGYLHNERKQMKIVMAEGSIQSNTSFCNANTNL